MCSTKALLGGDGDVISEIYRNRVTLRAARGTVSGGGVPWGWDSAYGRPQPVATGGAAPAVPGTPAPAAPGGKS
jgi:formate dehydrogenase iron-sulfur subunit